MLKDKEIHLKYFRFLFILKKKHSLPQNDNSGIIYYSTVSLVSLLVLLFYCQSSFLNSTEHKRTCLKNVGNQSSFKSVDIQFFLIFVL